MKITTINSIEVSSICDNACAYCPARLQGKHREVGLMTMETFERAIKWVQHFAHKGTQKELNLFGIGEPTLNPDLVAMVKLARERLPIRQALHLNTNGNTMTRGLAIDLKAAGISHIDISGHNAAACARCIRIFREVGIDGQLSFDYITAPNNWAGQVDWLAPDYEYPCQWLAIGQVMVMSSGDVTTCCIDAFGRGVFTHVNEDITAADSRPHALCESCHHIVPGRRHSGAALKAGRAEHGAESERREPC